MLTATPADSNQTLLVGEDGYVAGLSYSLLPAVQILGNSSLVDNRGVIHGHTVALSVGGSAVLSATSIRNSGVIEAAQYAITRYAGSSGIVDIVNENLFEVVFVETELLTTGDGA